LLAILATRDIDPGPARERIVRERDPARLDCWIARAATVSPACSTVHDRSTVRGPGSTAPALDESGATAD
jgi:hypothetical protein